MLDVHGIIEATQGSNREQALKLRKALRDMLCVIEEIHGLPRSVQTKSEHDAELKAKVYPPQREIDEQRRTKV